MSSALLDEAARIARQFDFPAEGVQRGVKEYIREIDEGLSKEGTTLSQIPTFVTSVPNGTEKVYYRSCLLHRNCMSDLVVTGTVPSRRSWRYQLSCVFSRSTR